MKWISNVTNVRDYFYQLCCVDSMLNFNAYYPFVQYRPLSYDFEFLNVEISFAYK